MEVQTSGYHRNQRMLDIFTACIQCHKRMFRIPIILWFLYKKMHAIRILVMDKWKEKGRRNCALAEFKVPLGSTGKKKDSK
jgi:hypothetical protein